MRALIFTLLGGIVFLALMALVIWSAAAISGGWEPEPGAPHPLPDWQALWHAAAWFFVPSLAAVGLVERIRSGRRSSRRHWGHALGAILVGAAPLATAAAVTRDPLYAFMLIPLQWNVVIGAGIEFSWLAARGRLE